MAESDDRPTEVLVPTGDEPDRANPVQGLAATWNLVARSAWTSTSPDQARLGKSKLRVVRPTRREKLV